MLDILDYILWVYQKHGLKMVVTVYRAMAVISGQPQH